jgi:hypothetical protein
MIWPHCLKVSKSLMILTKLLMIKMYRLISQLYELKNSKSSSPPLRNYNANDNAVLLNKMLTCLKHQ